MEGMIGGNFNTFGEQAPNMLFQNRKSVTDDDSQPSVACSTQLIERIEHQIEAELR